MELVFFEMFITSFGRDFSGFSMLIKSYTIHVQNQKKNEEIFRLATFDKSLSILCAVCEHVITTITTDQMMARWMNKKKKKQL